MALLGYGSAVQTCLAASTMVEPLGLRLTVADARFCKPLDHALIRSLAKSHEFLITVEEGSIGGFGSHVVQFLALDGLLDGKLKVRIYCYDISLTSIIHKTHTITSLSCLITCSGDRWFFLTDTLTMVLLMINWPTLV